MPVIRRPICFGLPEWSKRIMRAYHNVILEIPRVPTQKSLHVIQGQPLADPSVD